MTAVVTAPGNAATAVVEHRPRLHHDEPRRRRGHGRHDLALGNIPVANVKGFWVRRTAANTSALSNDGVTIAIAGDTGSL